jgi:heme/copper-type cytochrome/quinol oxidase subunit 2
VYLPGRSAGKPRSVRQPSDRGAHLVIPFKKLLSLNIALGVVSVLALILQYLALTDIAKQEADTILEWRVVGISIIVLAVFSVVSIITLARMVRLSDRNDVLANHQKAA